MKRLTLMSMVVVAGLLMVLAITIAQRDRWHECPPDCPRVAVDGEDARHMRLCQMYRWSDPEWWEKSCKI